MDSKPAIASVTIWGIVFAAICTGFPRVAAILHLTDPSVQSALQTIVGLIGTLISLCVALYGRFHTSTPIAGVLKTPASASTGSGLPPAGLNSLMAIFFIPALIACAVVASGMSACSTAPANVTPGSAVAVSASLRMNEGKALTAAYDAGDVLAVGLDAAAKGGVLKGASASIARQALMDLQVGLSTAQSAYAAGDATAAGPIASLAKLLSAAASAVPVSTADEATIQTAISLAQAFASAG